MRSPVVSMYLSTSGSYTYIECIERREAHDNGRVCAFRLDVLDEPREAPEHVQERDRRRRRARRAHEEDVRVALREVR